MKYNAPTVTERLLQGLSFVAALSPIVVVCGLVIWLYATSDMRFILDQFPTSEAPTAPLIASALFESILMVSIAMGLAIPVGIGTAIYLVEIAAPNPLTEWLEMSIFNLAGVPTILFGLAGIMLFGQNLAPSSVLWSGALILAAVALPIIVLASVQALRAVPSQLRQSALGLGASPWRATRLVVLPLAMPSVITGIVLALARLLGEAAALLILYGVVSTSGDKTAVLPVRIYQWLSSGTPALMLHTGTAVALLLACMASVNGLASIVRRRFREIR